MTKNSRRRQDLAANIGALLLDEGVAVLPLRELAARLGTSDRMLLYYFDNQADLTKACLTHLSAILAARLDQALPPHALPASVLARKLARAMRAPDIAPILRVWADVAARGARGETPFADFAKDSVASWLEWIAIRLDIPDRRRRRNVAGAVLLLIEGARALDLLASGTSATAMPVLLRALD